MTENHEILVVADLDDTVADTENAFKETIRQFVVEIPDMVGECRPDSEEHSLAWDNAGEEENKEVRK